MHVYSYIIGPRRSEIGRWPIEMRQAARKRRKGAVSVNSAIVMILCCRITIKQLTVMRTLFLTDLPRNYQSREPLAFDEQKQPINSHYTVHVYAKGTIRCCKRRSCRRSGECKPSHRRLRHARTSRTSVRSLPLLLSLRFRFRILQNTAFRLLRLELVSVDDATHHLVGTVLRT